MTRWDTVVIGSGSGGLTAALALARAGQKVLVVEQHYLPGGWTHSFSLEGYRFSPGVHYIGEIGPGGTARALYEGLGLGDDLTFCELNPDGFDHFLIAGERFDVPKGEARYFERLAARFPHERAGLGRYFRAVRRLSDEILLCDENLSFPRVLTLPFKARSLIRNCLRTQSALLDDCVRDPMLRAILSAQSGDHGLSPGRVSLPLHARMVTHYYDGGYYPQGGAKRIPGAMIKGLRRHGGQIRLRTRVQRILVEGGRAAGVELDTGERIAARAVVSNADPAITFGKLLAPPHGARERHKARGMVYSTSLLSVFCATDLDLSALGFDSGNYWWYRTTDVGGIYDRAALALPEGRIDGLFLTITTLKDPGHRRPNGHHTIEMFTFLPWDPFARWAGSLEGRENGYADLKERLGDALVRTAENVIPGLGKSLVFRSVGTPLTNDFYCETVRGAAYGTAKVPTQLGPFSFPIRSSVPGLYSCGASTLSHGVMGAASSGLMAAREILGLRRTADLLGASQASLRIVPADRPETWLADQEAKSGPVAREELEDVA